MRQKKKGIIFRRLLSLAMALCIVFATSLTAFASNDASPAVATAREGVLQVQLFYVDQNGSEHVLKTGSGFLIGAASGATTVITNHHVVALGYYIDLHDYYPDRPVGTMVEDKEFYSGIFGVDFYNANEITLKMRVVVKRDVYIEASYVNGSEKTDFAILQLSQAIYDRSPLILTYSDEVVETQNIYALGFPGITSAVMDDHIYTSTDVTITNGIVGKFNAIDSINFILHNAALGSGNSGGPLVDSNGYVVGVNAMYAGDGASNYYYSIAINEIADILDALGITYVREHSGSRPAVAPDITEAPQPTEDTKAASGENVNDNPVPTTAPQLTIEPTPGPGSTPTTLIIAIVAGVVVLLIIILVIVLMMNSKKSGGKNGNVRPPMQNNPNMGPNMNRMPDAMPQGRPMPPTPPGAFTPGAGETSVLGSGAGETSVLGVGAGETSVLNGGAAQPSAKLIRKKNGETVNINKPNFSIGKERAKVDFCIPDNNSISRHHASIVFKAGAYFIVDNNSTNYTYVNGNKIPARQEVKLNSGDKIKFADEEFEFRQ